MTKESNQVNIYLPGKPDTDGYFTEKSTVDGSEGSSKNPTIPEGFKPLEDDTTKKAHWKDENGHPSSESVKSGLVITSEDGDEFVWVPVVYVNTFIRCELNDNQFAYCNIQLDDQGNPRCITHNSSSMVSRQFWLADSDSFSMDFGLSKSTVMKQEPFDNNELTIDSLNFGSENNMNYFIQDELLAYTHSIASIMKFRGILYRKV